MQHPGGGQQSVDPDLLTSFQVEPVTLVENTCGDIRPGDGPGKQWFEYSVLKRDPQFTITYDGTEYTGTSWEIQYQLAEVTGEWLYLDEISSQCYQDQWKVNNTYQAEISLWGDSCIATCTVDVTIVPSLMTSLQVEDVVLYEGIHDNVWEWDQENEEEYYRYNIYAGQTFTIVYDGKTYSGTYSEIQETLRGLIEYVPEFNVFDNQYTKDTVFKPGNEYPVKISIMGCSAEFTATVKSNPITSLTVQDIELVEGVGGYLTDDGEGNTYFCYNPFSQDALQISVEMAGVTYSGSFNEVDQQIFNAVGVRPNYGYEYDIDQSYTSQWQVGDTHTATLYYCGKNSEFNIKIVASPIESIYVPDIEIIEGTSGYYDPNRRFIYQIPYDTEVTVVYNGEEYKRNYGELGSLMEELTGTWIRPSDNFWDLQYEEAWELENTYTAAMDLAGKKCEFQVQIVPSPMESISVPDIEIMEGTSGYYDPNRRFIYQIPYDTEVTVVYNGEEYKRNYGELGSLMEELTGIRTDPSDNFWNLQNEEAWKLGDSGSVTMYLAGETCDFQVQIVPSPIEKISVPNIEIMEGISGYYESDGRFTYQIPYDTEVTVVYNGEEYKRNYGELGSLMEELTGIWMYRFDNFRDLQYEEAWKLGDSGSVTVFLAGKECKIQVKIVPSLVESISVPDITIIEETSGSIYPDGRYYYEIPYDTEVTVVYNGEEYKRNYDEFGSLMEELTGTWIRPFDNFWVLQREEPWEAGNTYEAQMKIGGQTCNFKVTIESASDEPVESADYSAVEAALKKVPTDLSWYTLSSANALKAAIDAVDWDLTSEDQARVNEMAVAIENAIRRLIPINSGGGTNRANYSSVNSAVAKANAVDRSLYTEESLQALDAALAAIEKALPASQQSQVNKMAKDIEAAIAALVPIEEAEPSVQPADYSDVEAAISEASALDLSLYTNDSVAALQNAIAAVAAGMTEGEQDSVDAMAAAIHSAIAGLVMKPADGWTQSDGNWYYNRDGEAIKGWLFDNGAWYLFDYTGRMVTGWALVGNLWYFLKSDGVMAANEWIDGYWLSESGAWIYNAIGSWKQDAVGWWYGDTSGWYAANEIMRIDNVFYMFDASGYWVP